MRRNDYLTWGRWILLVLAVFGAGCGGGATVSSGSAGSKGSATLSWVAPTSNEDGTPANVVGFNIYSGSDAGNLQMTSSASASATGATIDNLPNGTTYFAVTAVSATGEESARSNVVSKIIN